MTKKLEEELNLPPIDSMLPSVQEEELDPTVEELQANIVEYQGSMSLLQRIESAMPVVQGFDELEREMDDYAEKAMATFEDLVDLGKNVEDRHAAPIFDSASKMLSAALQAKTAKLDKKMKMLELQQRQYKLAKESEKIDVYVAARNKEMGVHGTEDITATVIGDRSDLLAEIMKNIKQENDK